MCVRLWWRSSSGLRLPGAFLVLGTLPSSTSSSSSWSGAGVRPDSRATGASQAFSWTGAGVRPVSSMPMIGSLPPAYSESFRAFGLIGYTRTLVESLGDDSSSSHRDLLTVPGGTVTVTPCGECVPPPLSLGPLALSVPAGENPQAAGLPL